jgi:hypothetical protein
MLSSRARIALMTVAAAALVIAASQAFRNAASEAPGAGVHAPTPAPSPTVSPLSPLEVERVPVRWVAMPDLMDFEAAVELVHPFRGTFSEQDPVWIVRIANLDGTQRDVLSTGRWIRELSWDRDGLKLRAQTQRAVPSTLGAVTALWNLTMTLDPETAELKDAFEALPFSGCTQCEAGPLRSSPVGLGFGPSPDGRRLLLFVHYNQGITDPTRPPFLTSDVFIVEADGRSRRLEGLPAVGAAEGLPDLGALDWFPSGDMLFGWGGFVRGRHEDRFLVPVRDGDAVVFRESLGATWRQQDGDSTVKDLRVAFAFYDAAGPQGPGNYLGIFDTGAGKAWLLGTAPAGSRLSSDKPPSIALHWPKDSERFMAGMEPNSVLVDPNTGAQEPGGFADLTPPYKIPEETSPNGRYTAYFDRREPPFSRDPGCEGLPYRLNLRDERTNRTRVLLACETDVAGSLVWLSDKHLIARIYNCSQCGPTEFRVILIDITSGKWTSLTNGFELRASGVPAPDGKKVAVLGDRLRVFDDSGRLVEDYGPAPTGMLYLDVVWSPDSRSFAYVLAPEEFSPGI